MCVYPVFVIKPQGTTVFIINFCVGIFVVTVCQLLTLVPINSVNVLQLLSSDKLHDLTFQLLG